MSEPSVEGPAPMGNVEPSSPGLVQQERERIANRVRVLRKAREQTDKLAATKPTADVQAVRPPLPPQEVVASSPGSVTITTYYERASPIDESSVSRAAAPVPAPTPMPPKPKSMPPKPKSILKNSAEKHRDIGHPRSAQPSLEHVPAYHQFMTRPELFMRIHIHLVGVRAKASGPHASIRGPSAKGGAIGPRRSKTLGSKHLLDSVADPYVTIETVGKDTGSTDYFDVGSYKSAVFQDTTTPVWDAEALLITKKGVKCTSGLRIALLDKNARQDSTILEYILDHSDFPPIGGAWTEIAVANEAQTDMERERFGDLEFVFKVRITDGTDRIVSKETLDVFCDDSEVIDYTEEIFKAKMEVDNALLQCWRHKEKTKQAVLWIIGRNDCFMHPHVAQRLFLDNGYDLYVLNYRANGATRRRGWVTDAHLNSHNRHGTFKAYHEDIERALRFIKRNNYKRILAYAHSTGAPILLDYIIERGDSAFHGFIFNSPFLDWGWVGGRAKELFLKNVGTLCKLGFLSASSKLNTTATPNAIKKTPIKYLGVEVVMSPWAAKLWSQYYFDWRNRPLYFVPVTGGFANGVTKVHRKIRKIHKKKKIITSKPFLNITSRADDVLISKETINFCDFIGPGRCQIELRHNTHDVFLSRETGDTNMAIEMTLSWMKGHGYA